MKKITLAVIPTDINRPNTMYGTPPSDLPSICY